MELDFSVAGTTEIRRFILQLGAAAEVLEPAWLRKDIADDHARTARRGTGAAQESLTLDVRAVDEDSGA